MAHIQWKDRYNINFREIDAQHRGLLDLLNELSDHFDGGRHPAEVARIFEALEDYAATHFSSEERYMQAAGYPRLAPHRQEHAAFVVRLRQLKTAYDPADPRLVDETWNFLRDWYLNHITKSDQDYAPHVKRALPTAPIEAILFGLEGVLCSIDPAPLVQELSRLSARPEEDVQVALWEAPGFLRDLISGERDLESFSAALVAWAGRPVDPEGLAARYGDSFHPVPALLNLAARLKVYQPVGLVGDATPWMRSTALAQLGLEGLFTTETLSCEVQAKVPDKALFRAAAERLGLAPEACLLIHRDEAAIEAAQSIRMQTLHYTNPVMLMAELRRMGIGF